MAEHIEQTVIYRGSRGTDVRVYIFVGLFLMFMIVFSVYSAIKEKQVPARRRRRNEVQQGAGYGNNLILEDLYSDLESQSASYLKSREEYMRRTPKSLKPALIGKNAPQSRKLSVPPMAKYVFAGFIGLLLVVGIGVAISQSFSQPERNGQTAIDDFVYRIESYNTQYRQRWLADQLGQWTNGSELPPLDTETPENPLSWLHNHVMDHNRNLYESGQGSLPDPFSYSQETMNLSNFGFDNEEMIGFITIPSLDLKLPVFMGASRENLRRGLAHVTGTSLPIGGASTNAVISGYVSQGRNNILNGIGEISVGDEIHVTNFYETITYVVSDIHQNSTINIPTIQSSQDLLTIIGYNQGDPDRYTIIARRTY